MAEAVQAMLVWLGDRLEGETSALQGIVNPAHPAG